MLTPRRGGALLLVLGVAAALLALSVWGAIRLAWIHRANHEVWNRVLLALASAEVRHTVGRHVSTTRPLAAASGTVLTLNRLLGRWEVTQVAAALWLVRWGVGGLDGLWQEGAWLSAEAVGPDGAPESVVLVALPGLPPAR